MADNYGFEKLQNDFEKTKRTLPRQVGNIAKNHFQQTFRDQGFTDTSLKKWPEVQRRRPGTRAYKYGTESDRTRAILVKTGDLRNSIRVAKSSWNQTIITSDLKYASILNSGNAKMPKREFIGRSEVLVQKTLKKFNEAIMLLFSKK